MMEVEGSMNRAPDQSSFLRSRRSKGNRNTFFSTNLKYFNQKPSFKFLRV